MAFDFCDCKVGGFLKLLVDVRSVIVVFNHHYCCSPAINLLLGACEAFPLLSYGVLNSFFAASCLSQDQNLVGVGSAWYDC